MRVNEKQFIERVRNKAPLPDDESARRAIVATLEVLSERLYDGEAKFVAEELPDFAAEAIRSNPAGRSFGREEFFWRVAEHVGAPVGFSLEHAEVVCNALGDALPSATLERLQRDIPDLAPLFEAPEHGRPPERVDDRARPGNTLASGAPGSRLPISMARPEDRAHQNSVARTG